MANVAGNIYGGGSPIGVVVGTGTPSSGTLTVATGFASVSAAIGQSITANVVISTVSTAGSVVFTSNLNAGGSAAVAASDTAMSYIILGYRNA